MKKCKEFIKKHNELFLAILKLTVFALALFICFGVILGIKTMDSDYMRPGLKYRDNVVYSRYGNDYILRDMIIYEYEGKLYFGRIVGMPGVTIRTDANGNIFVIANDSLKEDIDRFMDMYCYEFISSEQYSSELYLFILHYKLKSPTDKVKHFSV